jgi:hypothetical protein
LIHLVNLTPAAEEGWWTLFDLAEVDSDSWLLVGGQMMHLHAAANGVSDRVRPTEDLDVVMNVRVRPNGTEWLARWLEAAGFELEGVGRDGIGHRFVRNADGGPGRTIIDILAPEGVGERASTRTIAPARTVEAPGTSQAFARSQAVDVTVSGMSGRPPRAGAVRIPDLLGALIVKAAATDIAARANPERDWQDAALLLSLIPDPIATRDEIGSTDRRRLRRLAALADRDHHAWDPLDDESFRRGTATLTILSRAADA